MNLLDRIQESVRKFDRSQIGKRIKSNRELMRCAKDKKSVCCPSIGMVQPAAWVINMNFSVVVCRIEQGLFIYLPKQLAKH